MICFEPEDPLNVQIATVKSAGMAQPVTMRGSGSREAVTPSGGRLSGSPAGITRKGVPAWHKIAAMGVNRRPAGSLAQLVTPVTVSPWTTGRHGIIVRYAAFPTNVRSCVTANRMKSSPSLMCPASSVLSELSSERNICTLPFSCAGQE